MKRSKSSTAESIFLDIDKRYVSADYIYQLCFILRVLGWKFPNVISTENNENEWIAKMDLVQENIIFIAN